MNPQDTTTQQEKTTYDVNGIKVRATDQASADTLASEIQSEQPVVRTPKEPKISEPRVFVKGADGYQLQTNEPKTAQQIQNDMLRGAQSEINALGDYYNTLVKEQQIINQQADRATSSISTLTGLAGSTEANVAQQATTDRGNRAIKSIQAEQATKVQSLLGNIRASALTEARAQREDARLDQQTQIANRKARQEEAVTQLQNISASGVTFDGLKKTDPESFSYLAKQFGSEDALKGAFVLNTPQDQIVDKRIEGGKYVIARQNPITGKINIETVDLGLPTGYSKITDAGDRLIAFPDNWDGDPSNLRVINKGLTPQQQAASGTSSSPYASDLDAIIGTALSTISTKFGQETFQKQLNSARNEADKINLVAAQVLKNQPAEIKRDFNNQTTGVKNIDKAISLLDKGLQTGVLENGLQYLFNLSGNDYDPKIAELKTYLTSAIQPYRNSVTGAAWGTQEENEYQSLFGDTSYEPEALKQRLTTLRQVLLDKSIQGLNSAVNPLGVYDSPFGVGDYAPQRILIDPTTGDAIDASGLSPEEYQQALNDGYTSQ